MSKPRGNWEWEHGNGNEIFQLRGEIGLTGTW